MIALAFLGVWLAATGGLVVGVWLGSLDLRAARRAR